MKDFIRSLGERSILGKVVDEIKKCLISHGDRPLDIKFSPDGYQKLYDTGFFHQGFNHTYEFGNECFSILGVNCVVDETVNEDYILTLPEKRKSSIMRNRVVQP